MTAQVCSVAIDGHRTTPIDAHTRDKHRTDSTESAAIGPTNRSRTRVGTPVATPTHKRREQLVLSGVHRTTDRARRGSRPATAVPDTVGRTCRSVAEIDYNGYRFASWIRSVPSRGMKNSHRHREHGTAYRRDERIDHNTRGTPSPRPGQSVRKQPSCTTRSELTHRRRPVGKGQYGTD